MRSLKLGAFCATLFWSAILTAQVPPESPQRDFKTQFRGFDKNSDGQVEPTEVDAKIWKRLQRADADGNGRVTLAELEGTRTKSAQPGGVGEPFTVKKFTSKSGEKLRYSWLVPLSVEDGKSYPLVVCLHGRGGHTQAATVLGRTSLREKHPCFVFAPECTDSNIWAATKALERKLQGSQKIGLVLEALEALLREPSVDPARVYVTGQSMGGLGTWGALAQRPELFAAAVPVCGAWGLDDTAKLTSTPIWAFHGALDKTVPLEPTQTLIAALREAGGTPKLTIYPDVAHGSWGPAYDDAELWTWMFQQRRPRAPTPR